VTLLKKPRYFGKLRASGPETRDHLVHVATRVGATLQAAMILEERLVTIEAQMVGFAREHPAVTGPFPPNHHNIGRELEDAASLASAAYPPEPIIELEMVRVADARDTNT